VPGNLNFDGVEYQAAPDLLLFDFYASGSTGFSRLQPPITVTTETDLTLMPMLQDLRQP
jgi:hypothetical protein